MTINCYEVYKVGQERAADARRHAARQRQAQAVRRHDGQPRGPSPLVSAVTGLVRQLGVTRDERTSPWPASGVSGGATRSGQVMATDAVGGRAECAG